MTKVFNDLADNLYEKGGIFDWVEKLDLNVNWTVDIKK